MHAGKGILAPRSELQDTAHLQIRQRFLLRDTTAVDPMALQDRMSVLCDDGTEIVVAVLHSSDQYLAVTGRVKSPLAAE